MLVQNLDSVQGRIWRDADSYPEVNAETTELIRFLGLEGIEEIERIAREIEAPLLINLVLGGMTPLESATRLQELGYAIAIHPGEPLARPVLGMLEGLCELNGGNIADYLPTGPAEFFNLVGMAEWLALDAKYAPTEAGSWA